MVCSPVRCGAITRMSSDFLSRSFCRPAATVTATTAGSSDGAHVDFSIPFGCHSSRDQLYFILFCVNSPRAILHVATGYVLRVEFACTSDTKTFGYSSVHTVYVHHFSYYAISRGYNARVSCSRLPNSTYTCVVTG